MVCVCGKEAEGIQKEFKGPREPDVKRIRANGLMSRPTFARSSSGNPPVAKAANSNVKEIMLARCFSQLFQNIEGTEDTYVGTRQ